MQSVNSDPNPIIVIAIGQCGITVAHQLFHQFECPHLQTSIFAQLSPSPHSSSQEETPLPSKVNNLLVPFQQLSRQERDARIQHTLATMSPPLIKNKSPPDTCTSQWIPRCVLLDTEPKVISHVLKEGGPLHKVTHKQVWRYHPKCVQWRAAGAANNWGYGYNVHGQDMYQTIKRGLRAQVKLATGLPVRTSPSFLVLHSVAGGTGSGVGTYMTQQLRRDYPKATIVNQIVWPFSRGEVVCQHYNMILTLAKLRHTSNLILILWNDHLHQICTSRLGMKSPKFSDLNLVIAHTLAQIITSVPLPNLISQLKPTKFPPIATVYHVPQIPQSSIAFTTLSWTSMLRSVRQMMLTHSPIDEKMDWTVSAGALNANLVDSLMVILRGSQSDKVDLSAFRDPKHFASSKPNLSVKIRCSSGINSLDKWAAIVCTSSTIHSHLSTSLHSALSMYHCGAYLHQYEKYGVSRSDFNKAVKDIWESASIRIISF